LERLNVIWKNGSVIGWSKHFKSKAFKVWSSDVICFQASGFQRVTQFFFLNFRQALIRHQQNEEGLNGDYFGNW
jgi:hypothetical protein